MSWNGDLWKMVEKDAEFTSTCWIIICSLLNKWNNYIFNNLQWLNLSFSGLKTNVYLKELISFRSNRKKVMSLLRATRCFKTVLALACWTDTIRNFQKRINLKSFQCNRVQNLIWESFSNQRQFSLFIGFFLLI